jgi:hypothetical protein
MPAGPASLKLQIFPSFAFKSAQYASISDFNLSIVSGVSIANSVMPTMPLIGVRISWLMFAGEGGFLFVTVFTR